MSSLAKPLCLSYRPGHVVHWIQARKVWDPDQPEIAVSATFHDDGTVGIEAADLKLTMWNHDPERFIRPSRDESMRAFWLPRVHVLSVNGSMFNLSTPEQQTPCVSDEGQFPGHSAESPVGRVRQATGCAHDPYP